MTTKEFVDFKTVKAAVTMVRILDHYGLTSQFKRSANGETLTGACPIHKGENPTQFRISIPKNCWNCFGRCQRGGNILDFVSRMEDCTIRQAAIRISEWFAIDSAGGEAAPAKRKASGKAEQRASDDAVNTDEHAPEEGASEQSVNKPLGFALTRLVTEHPYFEQRGITAEAVAVFGLGFCEKGSMAGRVVIPISNLDGKIVAYAGRWPGEPTGDSPKYKLPAGFRKSLEVFNLDRALDQPEDEPLIIVEGFFDCIRLWQLGARKTVALMGCTLSDAQEALLREHTSSAGRIILMLDEDEAGRAARVEIATRLTVGRFVKVVAFDEEGFQPEHLSEEQLARVL